MFQRSRFFAIPIIDFTIADRIAIIWLNEDRQSRSDRKEKIADRDRRSFDRRSLMLWYLYGTFFTVFELYSRKGRFSEFVYNIPLDRRGSLGTFWEDGQKSSKKEFQNFLTASKAQRS